MRESEVQREFRLEAQSRGALKSLFHIDSLLDSIVVNNTDPK